MEAAFDKIHSQTLRRNGTYETFAETPAGRLIWIIWHYDTVDPIIPNVFGEEDHPPIFVITAY